MKIAVTGASGQLGRLVIASLLTRVPADRIVALARKPDKVTDLDVEVRQADYDAPDTLPGALAGVDTLLLISSSEVGKRTRQHRSVIAAAGEAGVQRIVYTSLLHADTSPLSLAGEHRETEDELARSGIAYTLLRNGWYAENYTGSIPAALAGGAFIGSAAEGRIAAAARADYADAAATVLVSQGHEGRTYELSGDTPWTLADFAAEISRQTGRAISYQDLPEADYAAALADHGLPAELAQAIAGFDAAAAKGALNDDGHALSQLIGRPTTTLAQSVASALEEQPA